MILLSLTACSSPTRTVATRVDPSTVSLADHFSNKLPADTHTARVTITPPPANIYAPAPPATSPGAGTVNVTQAPPPVSVKVGDRTVQAPAGSTVSMEVSDEHTAAENTHDRNAQASGPTLRTDADKGNFDASAPKVELGTVTNQGFEGTGSSGGNGAATGSTGSNSWEAIGNAIASASSRISFWLGLFGVLLIVGAVVYVLAEHFLHGAPDYPLVAIAILAGIMCMGLAIVADTHPWVIVVAALLILVGIVAYVLWWKFGKAPAVTAAVATVETDGKALLAKIEAAIAPKAAPPAPPASTLNATVTTKP